MAQKEESLDRILKFLKISGQKHLEIRKEFMKPNSTFKDRQQLALYLNNVHIFISGVLEAVRVIYGEDTQTFCMEYWMQARSENGLEQYEKKEKTT